MPGALAGPWDEYQVACYVNLPAAREKLGAKLERLGELAKLPGVPSGHGDVAVALLGSRPVGAMRAAAADAAGAVLGVSVDEEGVHAAGVADFRPGTDTARRLGRLKNTDASLTAPLPDATYWACGGWYRPAGEGAGEGAALLDLLGSGLVGFNGRDETEDAVLPHLLDPLRPLSAAGAGSFGVLPGNWKQGLLRSFSTLEGDSGTTLAAARASVEAVAAGGAGPAGARLPRGTYDPQGGRVADVPFARFDFEMKDDEGDARDRQTAMIFRFLYGGMDRPPPRDLGRVGAIDRRTVLAAVNLDEAETKAAIAAGKAAADPVGRRESTRAVRRPPAPRPRGRLLRLRPRDRPLHFGPGSGLLSDAERGHPQRCPAGGDDAVGRRARCAGRPVRPGRSAQSTAPGDRAGESGPGRRAVIRG